MEPGARCVIVSWLLPDRLNNLFCMRVRTIIFALLGVFLAIVLLDSLGIFDDRSYFDVPHGNHSHYVPKDCNPPLPVSEAPLQRPKPGEKIDCSGRIVPANTVDP